MTIANRLNRWMDAIVFDLARQVRWSFLPPLMIYFAFGFSGLTAIVGTFFVKDYLDLSAAFITGLAFWAGLPWALKMPLGHLVDIIWRWKWVLVWLGAVLVGLSMVIMYLLITQRPMMAGIMPVNAWYVTAFLVTPVGLVIQDAVADAMSVEAVPRHDETGAPIPEDMVKAMHTTMQTLGRIALISGTVMVALLNIYMFSGIAGMSDADKAQTYAQIYLLALGIPLLSVSGMVLSGVQKYHARMRLIRRGMSKPEARALFDQPGEKTKVNPWYFIGGAGFVALTLSIGLSDIRFGQEIIFAGSMAIVLLLMRQLIAALSPGKARALVGTALIIFVFRAVPLPGPGLTWFEIDVLGFDQQFLSVLSLIVAVLTLAGMVILRPMMARHSITWIVVMLTLASGVLALPNIGLYYGIQNWTAPMTGGVVDARFIAVIDTAVESPLGQVAMIPMLAWIARNAPGHLKATFFAVMASFTNLALSASALTTRYLNQIFEITREVRDPTSDAVLTMADYSQLGWLLLVVAAITVGLPLLVVGMVQRSPLRSTD
ncbi:Folate transporter 3 [hydrothermal vent metagenome]|uniref:Folate transporter 3 n=1 Tax=hydrothermal vent metagenome TaxID=652676 RepID=A0A3B0RY06_9ZZZZ